MLSKGRDVLYRRTAILPISLAVAVAWACGAPQPTGNARRDVEEVAADDGSDGGTAIDTADGASTEGEDDPGSPPPDRSAPGNADAPKGGGPTADTEKDPLVGLPVAAAQLKVLCARNNQDKVSKAFCGATPPVIKSLADLQTLFDLNPASGNARFALTAHSSSLVARETSAINPRAIFFPRSNNAKDAVAMGFVRGEPFVEIVSRDPTTAGNTANLRFFLFKFQPACETSAKGCNFGDLLTPAVESNHTGVYTLYQDEDIKNTVLDCKQCHQPGGVTSAKILRMQELQNPWGHFFGKGTGNSGNTIENDFRTAHGQTEAYAGIPGNQINNSDPIQMEQFVRGQGFGNQPNEFNSGRIFGEVNNTSGAQPQVNMPIGKSKTWDALFQKSVLGQQIPPPYHDLKVTDAAKMSAAAAAYKSVTSGAKPASTLPDIRDVFLDAALPDLSFRSAPGLTANGILVQMCGQCHNSRLDQTLSRAKFNVDKIATMTATEKATVLARINLPADAARKMPPPRFKDLTATDIAAITTLLK